MSILSGRIHREDYLATPGYHPASTDATAMQMPMSNVAYDGNEVFYGTMSPLVTADGATVPAYADVTYPTVMPAGRP